MKFAGFSIAARRLQEHQENRGPGACREGVLQVQVDGRVDEHGLMQVEGAGRHSETGVRACAIIAASMRVMSLN